jgi:3-methyladenine DNA glycosylase AlkC
MPEPTALKHGIDGKAVRHLASQLVRAHPSFDAAVFTRTATRGLAALELKERVRHVIAALRRGLPPHVPDALVVLRRTAADWERAPGSLGVFVAWPLIDFVGVHGRECFDASMAALRELTPLFSAEFAIRPFIAADPERALGYLRQWVHDEDEHVRRLVSEGTRPRLPWGERLRCFDDDPRPTLALLRRLRDDPSEYVRRSVANHLNDIAKHDPERVVTTCEAWQRGASDERRALVRHALRTLVKDGHPRALRALGYDPEAAVEVIDLRVAPQRLRFPGDLTLSFTLRSRGASPLPVVVDYTLHRTTARGSSGKVFKLATRTLAPGEAVTIEKVHRLRPISTRTYHSGPHAIEVLVNGRACAQAGFSLRVPT